jgi:hypothetical protein
MARRRTIAEWHPVTRPGARQQANKSGTSHGEKCQMEMNSEQFTHFHHRLDPLRRARHAAALQKGFG